MKFKVRTIFLLETVAAILPMLCIIMFFYNTGIQQLFETRSQSYGAEIIKQAGSNVNTLVSQARFTEKQLSSSVRTSQIQLAYQQIPNQQMDLISELERLIWNYKQSAPYISDIYLFGHDNRLFSTTTTTDLASLKSTPWMEALDQPGEQSLITATHNAYYDAPSSILLESQREKYVVTFVRKVYHLGLEDRFSVIQMDLRYAEIQNIMDSVDLGPGGFAVIVNERDEIIYCEDNRYLGGPIGDYMDTMEPESSPHQLIQTQYHLEHVDWRIIGYVSTAFISEEFGRINRVFFMAVGGSLLAAACLSMLITKQITKPVASLSAQMKQVGRGNFNVPRIDSSCEEFSLLSRQFGRMVGEIDELMETIHLQEQQKAAIEYQALQNQINPHFLYNTLNTLKWMALVEGNQEMAEAIVSLVKMLRYTCSDNRDTISIAREIRFLRDYIAIQKLRYGNIRVEIAIQPGLEEYSILKFILQPIVENAIIHGLPDHLDDRRLAVFGKIQGECAVFTVADNGVGLESAKGDHYSGLGIENVQQRLRMHYGPEYGLTIAGERGGGTLVEIRFPLIPWNEEEDEDHV